ncbi:hypothetical protein MKW94_007488 [Papaver nudicaule]|uniref:FACT complex subunit n=1 Tax=Papaver nudicaule TaxID=74823 RepID=A0AA41RWD9_PAPNU|nr:hypothetical protein [Papaver nudicaule]
MVIFGSPMVASGKGITYTVDLENFSKRLKAFYSHWKKNKTDFWGASDAIVIATPSSFGYLHYLKSSALNMWLFGLEFPEIIMVFMDKQIHFLCCQKKASLLKEVKSSTKDNVGAETVMHVKGKFEDGAALIEYILQAISKSSVFEGHMLELWSDNLETSNFQLVDVSNGFSELFTVKDNTEINNVKKAALVSSSVMRKFVVPMLEKIIDEEKKVTHWSLMEDTEKALMEPAKVKLHLNGDNVYICYAPIFQNGGEFDLRPTASSNDENLYYDSAGVIICAIGAKYNGYCSNSAMQSKAYGVLLKAHEAAIGALKAGSMVSAPYEAALAVIKKDGPELVPNLAKTAGAGIGLEFRESGLILNAKNDRILKTGMVFNVSLGFQNLQAQTNNPKTEKYSLLLGDTVIVKENVPEVATMISSKAVKDVAYSFNEDD